MVTANVNTKFRVAAFLLFLAVLPCVDAQSSTADSSSKDAAAIEWPQFAQDLRRFDVVSFGLFPFAYLVTSFGYDLMRSAQHGWDSAYISWPLNGGWSSDDYGKVLVSAAIVSLSVAVIDMAIVWAKRRAAGRREEARSRPETEIRNTPLYSPLPEE
jgi:hypothetical protein